MQIRKDENGNIIQVASMGGIPDGTELDLSDYRMDENGNLLLDQGTPVILLLTSPVTKSNTIPITTKRNISPYCFVAVAINPPITESMYFILSFITLAPFKLLNISVRFLLRNRLNP